ncbi:MAG: PAS domain S-box protein [Flavobacteriales bacterium]|nr:PAS domain S-box protein [Flavobacteriales bacterium]
MERKKHRRVKLVFLFAIVFLIVVSALPFFINNNIAEAANLVKHSQTVKLELENTYSQLLSTETALRGYLLSKDSSFYMERMAATEQLAIHLRKVDSLTKEDPDQQRNIVSLRHAVRNKMDYMLNMAVDAATTSITPQRSLGGKVLMDEVRKEISKMQRQEDQGLERHTATLNKRAANSTLFTILLILAASIILVAAYLKISGDLVKSDYLKTIIEEREIRMQHIFDAAPDAVITMDHHGIITHWNKEAINIFGWEKNEAVGNAFSDTIIPHRYRERHIKGMSHYLKTGGGPVLNNTIEIHALRKDESEFPIELRISASKLNDNDPVFIGFIRDITARKKIEQALQNQTSQLVEAQQLAHIGSWEWDVAANRIEWSDELYRIYGLTPQQFEATYENFLKYIHPDDTEFVNGVVQQAFQDQRPFRFTHKVLRPDGTSVVVSSTGKVTVDSNGNTARMAGTAQDVTAQKEFEDELKSSEERFIKTFDNNPVAMTLSDIKTNKIRFANSTFCSLFGYTKEEVIGSSSEELNLIAPEENARLIALVLNSLQESRTVEELRALSVEETEALLLKLRQSDAMKMLEIEYTRKNGETFPALVSFEIISFHTANFTVTSYQDITERKKAEDLLNTQNRELERINKELETFTHISSHDLQEPLRKMRTFISRIMSEEHTHLSEKSKQYFERIHAGSLRMQTLIQDLLAFSRANTKAGKFEAADISEMVEEVKGEFLDDLEAAGGTIETSGRGNASIIVFQFRQMLHNLIGNALKFTKPGQPPHITIKTEIIAPLHSMKGLAHSLATPILEGRGAEWPWGAVHITITDNGIGFEPQYKERIFEMFQRLHSKTAYEGTGMGLAIVKKIVENHKGQITATSEQGHGARFDIYIPVT